MAPPTRRVATRWCSTWRRSTADINGNGQLFGPVAFVEALERVSDGQIKVEVTTALREGAPDAESQLVEAIASGDLDGGWPSTRAFAEAGIDGLQPVEAPMTITSYAAEAAVANGPVAEDLLDQLEGSGVTGLGLAVGPLRRPFAAEAPLLARRLERCGVPLVQLAGAGRRDQCGRRGAEEPRH